MICIIALLNHTLFMGEVNSTRLYDFAVRSLIRVNPLRDGLSVVLLLVEDLYQSEYNKLAVNIFNQGLHRISTLPALSTVNKKTIGDRSQEADVLNLQWRNSSLKKETMNLTRDACLLLQDYFLIGRNVLTTEFFPKKAYKVLNILIKFMLIIIYINY